MMQGGFISQPGPLAVGGASGLWWAGPGDFGSIVVFMCKFSGTELLLCKSTYRGL